MSETTLTTPAPSLPLPRLHAWLAPHLPALAALPPEALQAERLPAGQSNPTWLLHAGDQRWVLRAKPGPAAKLLPSAHAIEREFRIQHALQGSGVPVARMHALCEDESVIGAAFYVMEHVQGRILRDATLPDMAPAERAALHAEALRVLAALHQVDWRARDLADLGRSDGFFERTVARWTRQYRACETQHIEAMERLIDWLPRQLPPASGAARDTVLVHGDFRLENLVFHPTEPRVLAVLDWELATLGHPMSDLAYHCMAWQLPPGVLRGIAGLDLAATGIPHEAELMRRYGALSGRDAAEMQAHWPFYLACNCFRLAAILQGIARRVQEGMASHPQAIETARMAPVVAGIGWRVACATAVHTPN